MLAADASSITDGMEYGWRGIQAKIEILVQVGREGFKTFGANNKDHGGIFWYERSFQSEIVSWRFKNRSSDGASEPVGPKIATVVSSTTFNR